MVISRKGMWPSVSAFMVNCNCGCYAFEVTVEVTQLFLSMRPKHGDIHICEPTERFMGSQFQCLFFEVLQEKKSQSKGTGVIPWTLCLFVELPTQTEK
jgi:hypothetical protein